MSTQPISQITPNALVEVSDSGRILTILHKNGRLIAEVLVHGHFKRVLEACENDEEIFRGRANIFRGELFQLAGYEFLNKQDETIQEKI